MAASGRKGRRPRVPSHAWLAGWAPRETAGVVGATCLFSLGLGITVVLMPLVALKAGYGAAQIGVLSAICAGAQLGTRVSLSPVLRLWSDRLILIVSALLMASSFFLIFFSTSLVPFAAAEVLQGSARAGFWTGMQTHVVRMEGPAFRGLAVVNLVASSGAFLGPLLTGALAENDPRWALAAGGLTAALAVVPCAALRRFRVFMPQVNRHAGSVWRRPALARPLWGSAVAGAWRALLSSYVTVVLSDAGFSAAAIGGLVTVASGFSIAGAAAAGGASARYSRGLLSASVVAAGAGVVLAALLAFSTYWEAAALAVSGLGAGALQTLGPAVASLVVDEEERGSALAAAGAFRAAALLALPAGVAAATVAVPAAVAVALAGVLMCVPTAAFRFRHVRQQPRDLAGCLTQERPP